MTDFEFITLASAHILFDQSLGSWVGPWTFLVSSVQPLLLQCGQQRQTSFTPIGHMSSGWLLLVQGFRMLLPAMIHQPWCCATCQTYTGLFDI